MKEQILSFKSRPRVKEYIIQWGKHLFMQVNVCNIIFWKGQGVSTREGVFVSINVVISLTMSMEE